MVRLAVYDSCYAIVLRSKKYNNNVHFKGVRFICTRHPAERSKDRFNAKVRLQMNLEPEK